MLDGGMNSILLLTDKGDTLEIIQNPDDSTDVVKGGKLVGDRFAVIAYKEYGDLILRKAINITSLLGNWSSLDKSFEIRREEKLHQIYNQKKTHGLSGRYLMVNFSFQRYLRCD